MSLRLAVLASGAGSNAQAIIDAVRAGRLDADIRLIVSNRPEAGVLERAVRAEVPSACVEHRDHETRELYDAALVEAVRASGADTVALAGYMRLLTPVFLRAFPGRVLNIHPSLLPAFPGVRGGADAQAWGVKLTGCTVHFVEESMDSGAVIIQAAVPCAAGEPLEALMARIHAMEHRVYPQALQWFASGRLRREGRMVHIEQQGMVLTEQPAQALVWPPLEAGF
jgi:phosphoribosylglycinamide formyltransferase, formyltetrahydrofolate-dependent